MCSFSIAGEAREQLAQHRVLRVARGALVEGVAAEFDLEGLAHGFHRLVVLDRAAVEQLELALAVRAQAVGEGEALADLVAVGAAPAQFDARAADVGLFVFERALAAGAEAHDGISLRGSGMTGRAAVGADARRHEGVGVGLGDRPGRLAAGQVGADGARRAAAGAHGQDHGGGAGDDVAAGEHARHAGRLGRRDRRRCSPTC